MLLQPTDAVDNKKLQTCVRTYMHAGAPVKINISRYIDKNDLVASIEEDLERLKKTGETRTDREVTFQDRFKNNTQVSLWRCRS